MRQSVIVAVVIALAAALAPADTIYLRNGKTVQGKATPVKDDKMLIETPMGSYEVPAADVIQVVASSTPADANSAPAAAVERAVIPMESRRALPVDQMTNPEPIIFTLMKNLAVMAPGTETYNLRQQIEQWRSSAHDRKRKAQFEWVLPAEFARRRQLYVRTIKEAEELQRKIRPAPTPPGGDPNVERKKAMIPVMEKLDSAARGWADPLIRDFLMGVLAYDREDFAQSESLFRKCIEAEPLVAAFHQGRAVNLLVKNHALWGLEELMAALTLRPDSRELLSEIQLAIKKVPGTSIKDPLYLEAQRVLGLYADNDKKSYASTSATWFMPDKDGRGWQVRGESLPIPPYDRLVFRQAVGVPIGVNTLLVDASVVKDSLECFVRIDGNTMAPAWFKRLNTSGKAPALATLVVPGYEFTVPKILDDANVIPAEAPMVAHAVPAYVEMGSLIRKATGKLGGGATTDGSVVVSGTLVAGEAAAPVFVGEGALIGFLAGKTDVSADGGGPDRFIPLGPFSQVIRQLKTAIIDQGTYGRFKRTPSVRPAPGESFIVTVTFAETLE
jgi:hypothetical protein